MNILSVRLIGLGKTLLEHVTHKVPHRCKVAQETTGLPTRGQACLQGCWRKQLHRPAYKGTGLPTRLLTQKQLQSCSRLPRKGQALLQWFKISILTQEHNSVIPPPLISMFKILLDNFFIETVGQLLETVGQLFHRNSEAFFRTHTNKTAPTQAH